MSKQQLILSSHSTFILISKQIENNYVPHLCTYVYVYEQVPRTLYLVQQPGGKFPCLLENEQQQNHESVARQSLHFYNGPSR